MQRAAAAGDAQFAALCATSLPRAVLACDLPGEPIRDAILLRFDEDAPLAVPRAAPAPALRLSPHPST